MRVVLAPLLLLSAATLAHPGADARAHGEACAPPVLALKHIEGLTEEGRGTEARDALDLAAHCGLDPVDLDLARGLLLLSEGAHAAALAPLTAVVTAQPGRAAGRLALADALALAGDPAAAAEQHLAALELSARPAPGQWLDTARLLASAGRPDEARAVLERGLAAVGPVASLIEELVWLEADVELERALARLAALPRSAAWLQLRGAVLEEAGRTEAAARAYADAERLVADARPSRRQRERLADLRGARARVGEP